MTAVMKRTKPKLLLAIALVAFIAEEIWSLSTLGGQSVSSFGGRQPRSWWDCFSPLDYLSFAFS